jgi:hypothetical protein
MGFLCFSLQTTISSLNSINQLIFIKLKRCVLFEVQIEFLNIIKTSVGFKELRTYKQWFYFLYITYFLTFICCLIETMHLNKTLGLAVLIYNTAKHTFTY